MTTPHHSNEPEAARMPFGDLATAAHFRYFPSDSALYQKTGKFMARDIATGAERGFSPQCIIFPVSIDLPEIARQVASLPGVRGATVEQPACIHIHFNGGAAIVAGTVGGVWATDHYHDTEMTAPVGDAESTLPPDAAPSAVVAFIAKAIRSFLGVSLLRSAPAAGLPQFMNGKQFAEEMGARGMLYHIEDSPFEIEHGGGVRTFTDEQAELLKELCDTLSAEEAEAYFERAVAFNNAQPEETAAPIASDPAEVPAAGTVISQSVHGIRGAKVADGKGGVRGALLNVTLQPLACGCSITGDGTLQHPLTIEHCAKHSA